MAKHRYRRARVGTALSIGCLVAGSAGAVDLGVIQVESSTITDRFEDKRNEPSNIAVISGKAVDRAHTENIQQLLQSVPGITTEVQSGDSIKIHIRGVENQRFMGEKPGVAVVIDGVPVFERTGRVNIDLDNIESIKVIKGGASYLFGEDALGGAVIITTKRGADMAGVRVAGETGSFGYNKGLVRVGSAGDSYAAHVQVSRRESDGYYFQSDYQADYLNGKLQYYIDDASDITFGFEDSDRNKDSHGAVQGITQAEEDPQSEEGRDYARMFDVDLTKLYSTWSRDINATDNLMVNVYQFTDRTTFISAPQKYDTANQAVTDVDAYTTGNDYDQVQRGVKSEWRSAGRTVAWMGGLDLRANSYENRSEYLVDFVTRPFGPIYTAGTVTADNLTDETVRALYGEVKVQPAERWTVTLNGRYDAIDLDYTDDLFDLSLDKSFNVWSWRAGTNYVVRPTLDIYANAATGFRTPTVEQLFAGDVSIDSDTASNPDLDPEQSLNLEIGLRGKWNWGELPLDFDLAVFQLTRDDFIMPAAGNYSVPEGGFQDQFQNIGGVRNRGLELALSSDRSRPVFFDLAYTYLDAEYTDYDNYNLILGSRYAPAPIIEHYDATGNTVPRAPKHHVNLALGTRVNPDLTLTAEMDTISDYFADDLNRLRVDGHTTVNLLASYITKLESGNALELFARIDNVLDREYFNTARATGDSDADGDFDEEDLSLVVNQGRTFTVGLSMEF